MFKRDSQGVVTAEFPVNFISLTCGINEDCITAIQSFEPLKGFWNELSYAIPRLIRILHSLHIGKSHECYKAYDNGEQKGEVGDWRSFCAKYSDVYTYTPSFWETYLEDPVKFK